MSHLTKYKNNSMVNPIKALLEKTAKEMGLSLDYNVKTVRNSWVHADVDAGFVKNGKLLSIGIKNVCENGKTRATIVGDFYRTGLDELSFIDKFAQIYKKHEVIIKCERMGWNIDTNSIQIDKKTDEIVINAYRYVG